MADLIKPTAQQEVIVNTSVAKGELLLLNAYAGTGKTTTLEQVAKAQPHNRFLYLCFNRETAQEASRRFPKNCECRTTHSMAFQAVGKLYRDALGEPRPLTVMRRLNLSAPFLAVYVIDTVRNFLHSTDDAVTEDHVACSPKTGDSTRHLIRTCAKKLWTYMQDRAEIDIPMSHDGYLKLWAVSKPAIKGFDVILLDEAQDTNPVTLEIILQQLDDKTAGLIFVGDTHQSIYAWRHAVDAMKQAANRASKRLILSESFRFGPGVAHDASLFLKHFKSDRVQLIGRGRTNTSTSYAILSRTNASLIAAAIPMAVDGKPFHFSGTSEMNGWDPSVTYRFNLTLDVHSIWKSRTDRVKDAYLRNFRSFEEVKQHAEGESQGWGVDVELAYQVDLIETYGEELPHLLELIRKHSVAPNKARVTLSTVHRAKGREWDSVKLLDDFMEISEPRADDDAMSPVQYQEELNILYVAMTRARQKILYHEDIDQWLKKHTPANVDISHRLVPKKSSINPEPTREPTCEVRAAIPLIKEVAQSLRRRPLKLSNHSFAAGSRQLEIREEYRRAYDPWDEDEDEWLRMLADEGHSKKALANAFQRQPGAVSSRLRKFREEELERHSSLR